MKALMLEEKGVLGLHEIKSPVVGNNEVLVNIEITGCGGSEYLALSNTGIRPLPNIMGHSICGTTVNEKRVAIYPLTGCGQCSYCKKRLIQLCENWALIGVQKNGGLTQEISVSKDALVDLPDNVSWEQASYIEPFANSVNAWEISQADSSNSIAIIGSGSLGLGLVVLANKAGCNNIHVSDLSQERVNAATSLGATNSGDNSNETFDIVFDTVGTAETRDKAIKISKKGGKTIFLGFASPELTINMSEIIRHQKQLIGSFVYSKEQFISAIELVKKCNSSWVKNATFKDIEPLLREFLSGNFQNIKVALRPNK